MMINKKGNSRKRNDEYCYRNQNLKTKKRRAWIRCIGRVFEKTPTKPLVISKRWETL